MSPLHQPRHRFVLPVRVVSSSSSSSRKEEETPSLDLPPGKVLRLAAGTRRTLTPDLLDIHDSSGDPSKIR